MPVLFPYWTAALVNKVCAQKVALHKARMSGVASVDFSFAGEIGIGGVVRHLLISL